MKFFSRTKEAISILFNLNLLQQIVNSPGELLDVSSLNAFLSFFFARFITYFGWFFFFALQILKSLALYPLPPLQSHTVPNTQLPCNTGTYFGQLLALSPSQQCLAKDCEKPPKNANTKRKFGANLQNDIIRLSGCIQAFA